jgi:hypothetical protein
VKGGCRFVAVRNSLPQPIAETEVCSMPITGHSEAAGTSLINRHPRLSMTLFSCSVRALATS